MKLLILVSALVVTFSACVRHGIPEYFFGADLLPAQRFPRALTQNMPERERPKVLLVVPGETFERFSEEGRSFGAQYVFGVIPMTRLYFSHGEVSYVTESLLSVLTEMGYRPYLTTEDNLTQTTRGIDPEMILSLRVLGFSLNAYDLLFLRLVSMQGSLRVAALDRDGAILHQEVIDLAYRDYRSSAQALELLALLEGELKGKLRGVVALQGDFVKRFARTRFKLSGLGDDALRQASPVLILQPALTSGVQENSGELLAQSYGFAELPPMGIAVVSRLVQRGMESAVQRQTGSFVSALGSHSGEEKAQWELASRIEHLAFDEEQYTLRLALWLRLSSNGAQMYLKRCEAELPVEGGRDGYWLHTIEKTSAEILRAFLSGSGVGAACSG